jgi:oligo-1,6-glucosidase
MQWSREHEAGFTAGTPWLKVNPNYKEINVEDQLRDGDSVLRFYQKLIALRKSEAYREILTYGRFVPAFEADEDIFAFNRESKSGEHIFLAANFGKEEKELRLPKKNYRVLLTNDDSASDGTLSTLQEDGTLCLKSCGVIVMLEEA